MMAGPDTILIMWTIYDRPSDYPEWFVARKFEITGQGPVTGDSVIWGKTLTEARYMIYLVDPNASACLPRYDNDHPNVVETWL
jgi:hypothetical protein